MIITYIAITTIINLFLAYIWTSKTGLNLVLKFIFSGSAFFGMYLLLNLLPAVQLPNGIRLL